MRLAVFRRIAIWYLFTVGLLLHLFVLGAVVVVWHEYGFNAFARKVVSTAERLIPDRASTVRSMVAMLGIEVPGRAPGDGIQFPDGFAQRWLADTHASAEIERSADRTVEVGSVEELRQAVASAVAGDVITLHPGTYRIEAKNVAVTGRGLPELPIVVRAERLGDAIVEFDALEGFLVLGPNWHFENLEVRGVCAQDSDCEHAFHVAGQAHGFVVRHCVLRDFNAAIKGNGARIDGTLAFPDDGIVESSLIYNTTIRDTENPVTPIDVVGANGWVVRGNLIADFVKGKGDRISYAAFFKGNSAHGIFERNLVICQMNLVDPTSTALGLSLGGGGSSGSTVCRDGTCVPEHTDGIIRNNVVMHCSDVGIYLNRSADAQVLNNTLYDTAGIDVQFPESSALVANNLLSGEIRDRRGGRSERSHNLEGVRARTFAKWFVDPNRAEFRLEDGRRLVDRGEKTETVVDDFCGAMRDDGAPDIGAIEYSVGPTEPDPCRLLE